MTEPEIIAHNEALAISKKIQQTFTRQGTFRSMKLAQQFMGINAVEGL